MEAIAGYMLPTGHIRTNLAPGRSTQTVGNYFLAAELLPSMPLSQLPFMPESWHAHPCLYHKMSVMSGSSAFIQVMPVCMYPIYFGSGIFHKVFTNNTQVKPLEA